MKAQNKKIMEILSAINLPDGHIFLEIIFHNKDIKYINLSQIVGENLDLLYKDGHFLIEQGKQNNLLSLLNDFNIFPDYGSIVIEMIVQKGEILKYKGNITNRFSIDRFNSSIKEKL